MKICVLYNNPGTSTSENIGGADEDTMQSAQEVAEKLRALGYVVELLGISQDDIYNLPTLISRDVNVVFNLVEWSGRDLDDGVHVLEVLKGNGIPYTGCHADGYRISSDKVLMKQLMNQAQIPTPNYSVAITTQIPTIDFPFPVIVKPSAEHCGIGITQSSVVNDIKSLSSQIQLLNITYQQPLLIEEFIEGLEAHVTVIEKDHSPWVLPPAVFRYQEKPGYWGVMSYEAKWNADSWEAKMTEWEDELSSEILERLTQIAQKTFVALGGRSHSRVDIRLKDNEVYVLEINNNPGVGWDVDSGLTHSCIKAGLSHGQFLNYIILSAL